MALPFSPDSHLIAIAHQMRFLFPFVQKNEHVGEKSLSQKGENHLPGRLLLLSEHQANCAASDVLEADCFSVCSVAFYNIFYSIFKTHVFTLSSLPMRYVSLLN